MKKLCAIIHVIFFNDHPRNLKSVSPPHVKLVCFPFLSTDSPTNKRKKGNVPSSWSLKYQKKLKIKQATWPHKLDPACTQRTLLKSETFFSLVHLNPEVYTICKKIFYWHTREVFAPFFLPWYPSKTNMFPERAPVEKRFSFSDHQLSGNMSVFGGVILVACLVPSPQTSPNWSIWFSSLGACMPMRTSKRFPSSCKKNTEKPTGRRELWCWVPIIKIKMVSL